MNKGNKSKLNYKRSNRSNRRLPISVYSEPGDQIITFKQFTPLVASTEQRPPNSGLYVSHGKDILRPYYALTNSPYQAISEVYLSWRVIKIRALVYFPSATSITAGYSACKMFRDQNQASFLEYENLVCERSVKRGRLLTRYTFDWSQIEPSDFEYIPVNPNLDDGRLGSIFLATIGQTASDLKQPEIEYTYTVEFKYLKQTVNYRAHRLLNSNDDDYDFPLILR